MSALENRIAIEKRIVRAIVKNALATGHTVSVYDGEEWALRRADKLSVIMSAVMTTDVDVIAFRKGEEKVGNVTLVYGNDGWDVIADHTDNDAVAAILAPAIELGSKLEL